MRGCANPLAQTLLSTTAGEAKAGGNGGNIIIKHALYCGSSQGK